MPDILPFNVLTGFLGAGKTTLLNALLKHPRMQGALVIVNEFGQAGLDHLLVEASPGEVIELSSGCLCCALRGDLVETLVRVLQERDSGSGSSFNRIIVETSGLADPAPILHTIMGHPWLTERLKLDGLVTVVDALTGEQTLKAHEEAVKQAAVAERLVITKTDMLPAGERPRRIEELRQTLHALNPTAEVLISASPQCNPQKLFQAGLADARTGQLHLREWLRIASLARKQEPHGSHAHAAHSTGVNSFAIIHDAPLAPAALDIFIDLLRANFGAGLLRVKGIVKLTGDPSRPVVIHGVQHIFHPPARLPAWPDGEQTTRLVFITRGIAEEKIRALFAAVADPLTGNGAALADGTLSLLPKGDG